MGGLQGEAVERGAGAGQAGVAGVHEDVEAVNTERGWGLGSIDSPCQRGYDNPDSLWTKQARPLTPRKGTVAHLGNQGCCIHVHTRNLSGLTRIKYAVARGGV